ncbi:hypothetical protein GAO09_27760 [Rhizobiales bacterium RZME27]|uniref:Uncharacterized protein n=1 Tax=Endobacterium cereale TaxID=2663029 RepID=A0A6A8AGC5_9HYPH|nr:hypothetical protein [Endobacterium cereale]MEB2842914.1 hypothetical protein [Endobacterium cereale]MQY49829.1 hypothetical protein [Endobacterium cereale]
MKEAEDMNQAAAADGFTRETAYNKKMSIFSLIVTVLFVMFPRLPMRWLPPVPQPAADVPPSHRDGHDETPRIAAE